MTRQPPPPLHARIPALLRSHIAKLGLHTQQITTLQSKVAATSALVPGDWEDISLANGWGALSGYIPPQVRILQNGMSQLIGHVTGGTTTTGTVIGTLTSGYYNTVHAHTFTCNAVTGAATSSQAGALSSGAGTLSDIAGDLNSGTVSPSPAAGTLSGSATLGQAITYANALGSLINTALSVPTGATLHSGATALSSTATATPVNMNTPTITLDTAGNLTISNVDPNVTTLSFSELIPLITA